MLDIQLGRRNLSPIQRIAITEKYRPIYERQAKESQGTRNDLKDNIPQNIGESEKRRQAKGREVNSKLAKVANVNPETYRQAKRILDSDNKILKDLIETKLEDLVDTGILAPTTALALVKYVELKGYKNGEIRRNHSQDSHNEKAEKLTLDEIAKQLGISKANLTRVLSIERNLTDSMKELLDTGVITKTLVFCYYTA